MAAGMVPGAAMAVSAEFSDKLVASLADLYDGDTARAREELEALSKEEGFEITDELIEGVAGGVACPIHGCDTLNDTCRELCVIL